MMVLRKHVFHAFDFFLVYRIDQLYAAGVRRQRRSEFEAKNNHRYHQQDNVERRLAAGEYFNRESIIRTKFQRTYDKSKSYRY